MFILLDVNSGNVYSIDDATYNILDYYPNKSKKETIDILKTKYDLTDLNEAINEINILMQNNELFSKSIEIKEGFINNSSIKAMCLHVSHDCNISCNYCFASQGNFHGETLLMSEEVGKKAIDFLILNSKDRKNLEVDFFGGEPLLNLDVVRAVVTYAKEKGKIHNKNFRFTITTNAVLLNDKNMDYLNDNMHNIVLSIDGRKEVNDRMRHTANNSGTYDVIIKNIKEMVNKRGEKDYYVRGTYTKYNLDFSNDVLHLSDCGFKNISVEPVVASPASEYALSEEDLPILFKEYEELAKEYLNRKEYNNSGFDFFHFNIDLDSGPCLYKRVSGCGAGNDYIAVTPKGEIYPCHQFVGNDKFKLGDFEQGIINTKMKEMFYEANLSDKPQCNDCWAKFYCGGGCLANAYSFNSNIMIPDKIGCELEKKRLECAIMIEVSTS